MIKGSEGELMIISKNYLTALTDESAPEREITARDENGALLFRLQLRLGRSGTPFYLDMRRFKGKDIRFYCLEEEFFFDAETDEASKRSENEQRLRPRFHYTVPYGWLNDPNGLAFFNGKYHIFCQHNPFGTQWGNMHWHHSTTTDFLNFEHMGDALFPDCEGTIFSGSAVCDTRNVSGFGRNSLLLFYTLASYDKPEFSQCLAYSEDGVHFRKYEKNPIIPNIKGENRDPKVVYVTEMSCYVMALYLDGDEYALFKSRNLTDWEQFQSVQIEGDAECPDLYYLKDCGRWILSGASDYYIVGRFDENGFSCEQKPLRFYCELDGRYSYAGQSFYGTDGRVLRLTWENINPENNQCFCGQLSVPFEMGLTVLSNGEMRLRASLCREIESRLRPVEYGQRISGPYVADIRFDSDFTADIDGVRLRISPSENRIFLGEKAIPLTLDGEKNIRLIVDRISVEILADNGLIFTSFKSVCNDDVHSLSVISGEADISVLQINNE